jgi:hypothetical protein
MDERSGAARRQPAGTGHIRSGDFRFIFGLFSVWRRLRLVGILGSDQGG